MYLIKKMTTDDGAKLGKSVGNVIGLSDSNSLQLESDRKWVNQVPNQVPISGQI